MVNWPTSTSVKDLYAFLGLMGFYLSSFRDTTLLSHSPPFCAKMILIGLLTPNLHLKSSNKQWNKPLFYHFLILSFHSSLRPMHQEPQWVSSLCNKAIPWHFSANLLARVYYAPQPMFGNFTPLSLQLKNGGNIYWAIPLWFSLTIRA